MNIYSTILEEFYSFAIDKFKDSIEVKIAYANYMIESKNKNKPQLIPLLRKVQRSTN
jgi:hypothetical protein